MKLRSTGLAPRLELTTTAPSEQAAYIKTTKPAPERPKVGTVRVSRLCGFGHTHLAPRHGVGRGCDQAHKGRMDLLSTTRGKRRGGGGGDGGGEGGGRGGGGERRGCAIGSPRRWRCRDSYWPHTSSPIRRSERGQLLGCAPTLASQRLPPRSSRRPCSTPREPPSSAHHRLSPTRSRGPCVVRRVPRTLRRGPHGCVALRLQRLLLRARVTGIAHAPCCWWPTG